MSDYQPSFSEGTDIAFDELVTGGPVKTRSVTLTNNQSVGALSRGAVLGLDSGKYAIVHQTGSYPASTARAILAEDADPSSGDVTALVYEAGDFNEDSLSFGGTVDADDVREYLRALDIFLKDPVSA